MKKVILILVVLLVALFAGYKYLYKSHRDINSEKTAYDLSSTQFVKEYLDNEEASNTKYLDKTVSVKGIVTQVNNEVNSVVLDSKILCVLTEKGTVKLNDIITVKGRVLGFDSLLEEINLDQCTITK